jgi:hypothetical protein
MNRLVEILESFRPVGHRYNDDDCWYSCPQHPEYCGDKTECDCWFYERNAKVDEALKLLKELAEKISSLDTDQEIGNRE